MQISNLLLLADGYKSTHWRQYPPNMTKMYSYLESRGGHTFTVFFGLQYILRNYLSHRICDYHVDEASYFYKRYFGDETLFNFDGWRHIVAKHNGRLPISIKAVPEGSVVTESNVLMTIENTCPDCAWLTNYLETLLMQIWYPCTVATVSWHARQLILAALERSGNSSLIDYKLHDFGMRGVSSMESAGIGGMAHLVNFNGTDTVPGCYFAEQFYKYVPGNNSIPAAEHSTVTVWGKENEVDAYRHIIQAFPKGMVSIVADSYNINNACEHLFGEVLKKDIASRQGTLIIRPDSGIPHLVVNEVLHLLGERFGYMINEKGFRVLPPYIRVIQGDGVDLASISNILISMERAGWSADNIAFGMGGALLQRVDRDTQKFAIKASHAVVDGFPRDVYKCPVGSEWKRSKKGRLKLVKIGGWQYQTRSEDSEGRDELIEVYRDGEILVEHTFDEIRKRAATPVP